MKIIKESFKILTSKEFWQDFANYYSRDAIAERIDKFAERLKNL